MSYGKIHFVASEPHFADHLIPVHNALPEEIRGPFHGSGRAVHGELTVVASWGDLSTNRGSPCVLFEHGVGQTYADADFRNFAGGPGRDHVVGFAVPNAMAAERNAAAYPGVPQAIVGIPRLHPWLNSYRMDMRPRHLIPMYGGKRLNREPVVAVSFHWDSFLCPETRTTFPYYREAVRQLAMEREVIGHGHPRIYDDLEPIYKEMGIEPVREFNEVLDRASLYVCDNSSTLYEFAATDRPVVVLNQPSYRRHVEHGLRFWSHAHVGLHCDHPADLSNRVSLALRDLPEVAEVRRRVCDDVIPMRTTSVKAAVNFLRDIQDGTLRVAGKGADRNLMTECSCGETMRVPLLVAHKRQKGCQ